MTAPNGAALGANRLPALAGEISRQHDAAYGAFESALDHAAECGRLLFEAKGLMRHGEFLPWLKENTKVSYRQSQKYMRLSRGWPALKAKCELDSHLTLTKAIALLTQTEPDLPDEPPTSQVTDVWAWAEAQLNGPFTAWDFTDGRDLLQGKLLRKLGVPWQAQYCLDLADECDLPCLCLAPMDDLLEAARLLTPIAEEEATVEIDTKGMRPCAVHNCMLLITWIARFAVVKLSDEVEHRNGIDDDTWWDERRDTVDQLAAFTKRRVAVLADLSDQHKQGGLTDDGYGAAIAAELEWRGGRP